MNKLFILSLVLLSGCVFNKPEPPANQLVCAKLERQSPRMLPVKFEVATSRDTGAQVFGLNGREYSKLAINTRRILNYSKESKLHIDYLEDCIDRYNAKR